MSEARQSEDLERFETPVGVVDVERARANARRAAQYCAKHGLHWRPHVKTHKSTHMARIQIEEGAAGLTVATPREAEVMSQVTDDILLAYPPLGSSKVDRLMSLLPTTRLTVGLDSEVAMRPLAGAAAQTGRSVGVLVELDVGLGRVGVTRPEEAIALAELAVRLPGVEYRGVMFYPGHLRSSTKEQADGLATLSDRLGTFVEALSEAGVAPGVVSGGSTPTLWQTHLIQGVTEVRPGTCIYNDRDILQMGVCQDRDIAYSVLATVVSTAIQGQAVVDAGSKALAKESFRAGGEGFGVLLDRPEVWVRALSEEHGVLDLSASQWRPSVGDRVRIVPNHVCVSVNLQDHVVALTADGAETWPLDARGRGRYDSGSLAATSTL